MNIYEFESKVETVINGLYKGRHTFAKNMINQGLREEEKSFCEWLMMFLAWSEISDLDDCKRYYWQLDEEEA